MIKNLQHNDIGLTPFIATTTWNPQNVRNSNLILWSSGSLSGSISMTYLDYGDGSTATSSINSSCSLALSPQSGSILAYQRGLNISGTFFPTSSIYYNSASNPLNLDYSYMRLVYTMHKNLFYNSYNNPSQIYGLENINLQASTRLLTNVMDIFTLKQTQFGEKILPNSVRIVDTFGDEPYILIDDGNTHLKLSGSYFINYQKIQFEEV